MTTHFVKKREIDFLLVKLTFKYYEIKIKKDYLSKILLFGEQKNTRINNDTFSFYFSMLVTFQKSV